MTAVGKAVSLQVVGQPVARQPDNNGRVCRQRGRVSA